MLAITTMQRRFVQALYYHTGNDACAALRLAGYKGNPNATKEQADRAIKKQSDRWRHHELVLAAITEYGRSEYNAKLPLAVGAVGDILKDPKSRDRLRAIHGVLDRVGMHAVSETRVTHAVSIDDMKQQLKMLLAQPALKALLPRPTETAIVDAQFSEVKDTD
jgi:hypothetical protein